MTGERLNALQQDPQDGAARRYRRAQISRL